MFGKLNYPSKEWPLFTAIKWDCRNKNPNFEVNNESLTYKLRFTIKHVGGSILAENKIFNRVPHAHFIPYDKWKGKREKCTSTPLDYDQNLRDTP